MHRRKSQRIGYQARLLRIALVSLPVILILSLLVPVVKAATGQAGITIKYHGKTIKTTANPGTVGELLDHLGLEVSGEDVLSHGLDETVAQDMVIAVDRIVTVREVYTTTIAHTVSTCRDPSIPEGMEEVLVKGVDGELQCTADVTYVNGKETSRTVIRQDVTKPMVEAILAQGTGEPEATVPEAAAVIEDGYITLSSGEVLTYTEVRTMTASAYSHMDKGCDSITATGTQVHWGTVAVDPKHIPYGTRMFITSADGSFIYGIACAEDFGGSITKDRIDLYMPTYHECIQFGRQECLVYFLG